MKQYYRETKTKFITSSMKGLPPLENKFGSLRQVLKTALSLPYNAQNILNVTIVDDLLKITLNINHGFLETQVVSIRENTSPLKGEYRIIKYNLDTIWVAKPISLMELGVIEGLTIEGAPLGYSIVYDSEEELTTCFKNKSVGSPGILKLIDSLPPNGYLPTWSKFSRVVIGQEIDSYGNFISNRKAPYLRDFPNIETEGNGVVGPTGIHGFTKWFYAKRDINSSSENDMPSDLLFPTDWIVIGDDLTFYLMIRPVGKAKYGYDLVGFGNYVSENDKESTNICLQASFKFTASNVSTSNNSRIDSYFGALNYQSSGILFSDIYGSHLNSRTNYTNIGLNIGSIYTRPWEKTNTTITVHPYSGRFLTSELYIKDPDSYIRGKHRGVYIMYGPDWLPEDFITENGEIFIYTQVPVTTTSDTRAPMIFSLKNWEI